MHCCRIRAFARPTLESISACERPARNWQAHRPYRAQTELHARLDRRALAPREYKLREQPLMAVHNPRFRQYHVKTMSVWVKKA